MKINRRKTGCFLFLTALWVQPVISESSSEKYSYIIDDSESTVSTMVGETGNTVEHPVKRIKIFGKSLIEGFDLSHGYDYPETLPFTLKLGQGSNNKESDTALQFAIKRIGEVIENSTRETISGLLSGQDQITGRHVHLQPTLNYIVQDTYTPFVNRIDRKLIKPSHEVSLLVNDNKHNFGDIWLMVSPSSDRTRGISFFVVYLDQGTYLFLHEHGLNFLDLKGFGKLVENSLRVRYTWESSRLAQKTSSIQFNSSLYGYLPSAENIFKGLISWQAITNLFALIGAGYMWKWVFSSKSGADNAPTSKAKKPKKIRNPQVKDEQPSNGYCRMQDCREGCEIATLQCQLEQRIQQERIQQLRKDISTAITVNHDDRERMVELEQSEAEFVQARVERLLLKRLQFEWDINGLIDAIFHGSGNDDLLKKLRGLCKKPVSNKILAPFKEELDRSQP